VAVTGQFLVAADTRLRGGEPVFDDIMELD